MCFLCVPYDCLNIGPRTYSDPHSWNHRGHLLWQRGFWMWLRAWGLEDNWIIMVGPKWNPKCPYKRGTREIDTEEGKIPRESRGRDRSDMPQAGKCQWPLDSGRDKVKLILPRSLPRDYSPADTLVWLSKIGSGDWFGSLDSRLEEKNMFVVLSH